MVKKLEILLKVIFMTVLIGFTLTTLCIFVNESEIEMMFASITSCIALPLLLIAVIMVVKIN